MNTVNKNGVLKLNISFNQNKKETLFNPTQFEVIKTI